MAELVSRRYALSLFEAGLELEKTEALYKELKFVEEVFQSEDKIFAIFKHPRITRDEKKSMINSIFTDRISQELLNFLFIIIDRKREKYLLEMIDGYNEKYNEYMNIVDVLAVTAIPMEEKAKDRLTSVIEEKLNKKVQLKNQVDESIIGGVMLRINNKFMDSTIRSQLRSIETAIKGVSL